MALYRILRGTHYSENRHLPNSQETNLAALLGDIELIAEPTAPQVNPHLPVPPLVDTWSACVNPNTEHVSLCCNMRRGEVMHFDGQIDSQGYRQFLAYVGSEPPAEIVEQYKQLTQQRDPDFAREQWQREKDRVEEASKASGRACNTELYKQGYLR